MADDSSSVLDAMQVADLVALDKGRGALFAQLVSVFLSGADERIAQLRRHAESADAEGLADAAHALTGSSGNLGAARLAALFGRIENAGKRQDVGAAKELLALLDAEYALARGALLAAAGKDSG